jgi:uncharacterized membrane protein (DUF2068 family)
MQRDKVVSGAIGQPARAEARAPRAPTLYAIIALKLGKGLLLLLIGLGVYTLAGKDLQEEFGHFLRWIKVDPENVFFSGIGQWLDTFTLSNVRWVATGTLLYSLFSLVEGFGLIFRVSWAGWMAIGESAFFIPIEIFELTKKFSLALSGILIINVVIVWYLVKNRGRLFHHH